MGQEQSYSAHVCNSQIRRYKDKYDDPLNYRGSPATSRASTYEEQEYKRHKPRRSADSIKSANSSTESSGYRSGSSTYEYPSDRSTRSEYYCTSLYKNDHYKDVNKELYKPVKIPKEKRYKLQLFDIDDDVKTSRLSGYLSESDKGKQKTIPGQKKAGIRNYTPKILSEEEQKKKRDSWI